MLGYASLACDSLGIEQLIGNNFKLIFFTNYNIIPNTKI